jgi:actin-like ATPase involved in cell morphogenesis
MKNIQEVLKDKYGVIIGELELERMKDRIREGAKRLKVNGRDLLSGEKKTACISIKSLLGGMGI